ncbi:hypothetical protein Psed_6815 (plasmid) [Pseudonocardia dioxanivorans CB1190]|uniref:DUF6879 domain-containing protein n=1 Tax=Pseudonocardia dioxanivorans (strain ATCC 55486 / DSM 44775 / JCM 13855 / CB1190) TaxID=675635 RepID=F2L6J2_PSEUX|nr:DUF6879 family protein [Pseudonocardia dioxanivorans]AEA28886.1 hypothetical protein Psed_6815 [Pseudonocardia dioxanivorans CB1190]
MSAEELGRMYGRFTDYAWRYEGRDVYTVDGEQERIDAFLRSGVVPRKTRDNNGWIRVVEDVCARGASVGRVRVVGHPVTDYTRFEFAAYPDNIDAGEDVQVIERQQLDRAWDSVPDFWLFDDTTAFVQHFDEGGRFLGAELVDNVAPFLEIRRMLLEPGRTVGAERYALDSVPQQRRGHVPAPPALHVPSLSH